MNFMLDTNVLTPGRLRQLVLAMQKRGGKLYVPALVHAERLFQLRRQHGAAFNPAEVEVFFDTYREVLEVQPMDRALAEALANTLCLRHPTQDAWLAVKRQSYLRAIGREVSQAEALALGNRPCGAPLDLYLAALASPECPIITEDAGHEWTTAPPGSVLKLKEALARLEAT